MIRKSVYCCFIFKRNQTIKKQHKYLHREKRQKDTVPIYYVISPTIVNQLIYIYGIWSITLLVSAIITLENKWYIKIIQKFAFLKTIAFWYCNLREIFNEYVYLKFIDSHTLIPHCFSIAWTQVYNLIGTFSIVYCTVYNIVHLTIKALRESLVQLNVLFRKKIFYRTSSDCLDYVIS